MGLNSSKIKSRSTKFSSGNSMALAAETMPEEASEEDVREAVASIVTKMLEERWALVRWVIGEKWAAKLVARIVDAVGKTILAWL